MSRQIRIRTAIAVLTFMLGLAFAQVVSARKVTLTVWHALAGGDMAGQLQDICKQFEKSFPEIKVQLISADVNGEKFLTAMAAGAPPDVIFPDGSQVIMWAYKDLLAPLDTFIKSSKVDTSRFFSASFKPCTYKGKPYALPWLADANFAMVYYKPTFNEVGLGKGPETWDEFELAIKKLYKQDANGQILRMGFKGWDVYGAFNTLFTIGGAFGGDLYDDSKERVTMTSPGVERAFEWVIDLARRSDWTKVQKWQEKYASWGKPDPVASGRLGMALYHSQMIKTIELAKKRYEDFGFGYLPGPSGGRDKTAWIGGWTGAIPKNSRNKTQAWTFIKWLCYDPVGNGLTYSKMGFLPTNKTTDVFTHADAKLKPWINVLHAANIVRPITPVMPKMSDECDRIFPLALSGKREPRPLLVEAQTIVQKELERITKKKR